MRKIIYPYKLGSASSKLLSIGLETKRVKPDGKYKKRVDDLVINWGSTKKTNWGDVTLNKLEAIEIASDKVKSFDKLKSNNIRTVEFTKEIGTAMDWIDDEHKVYCRTKINSHSGIGIVIATTFEELVQSPLYTKGIINGDEYRLHVWGDEVIDYTKKIKLNEQASGDIKSHDRGWTFARNVEQRDSLKELAVSAIRTLGLDFGAVDIITNPQDKNRPYILEINTAPGLTGRTLEIYINKIKSL